VARTNRRRADVEEREGAGAIGRFDHAGTKAALPDQGRLLVAGECGDRHRRAEQSGRRAAEIGGGVADFGKDRARDAARVEQLVVPVEPPNVEQHRTCRVGRIGRMQPAAGEPPQQKAVDRAEEDFAVNGAAAQTCDVVEQPADLRRREIGVDDEPGALGDQFGKPFGPPALAQRDGAPVLPDHRIRDRPAAGTLPQHHRLALVGDADRRNRPQGAERSGAERRPAGLDDAPPDLFRVVLDPARLRVMLSEFGLGAVQHPAIAIEQHRTGAGRSLVDRQNERRAGHRSMVLPTQTLLLGAGVDRAAVKSSQSRPARGTTSDLN
jgi:hypothetical protein